MKPVKPKQHAGPASIRPFALSGLLLLAASCSAVAADDEEQPQMTVSYGILWDGRDPVAGSASCQPDKDCQLIDDDDIRLTLHIPRTPVGDSATLSVSCGSTECSFAQSRYRVWVGSLAGFDLYEGPGYTMLQAPVITVQRHLGVIKLRVAAVTP